MKIDFEMLEEMVNAGATGAVILAYLRKMDRRRAPRRTADKVRKQSGKQRKASGNGAENGGIEQQKPDVNTGPRARLFAMVPRLVQLGLVDEKARSILGQWAKITHDNIDAIDKALGQAELKRPADAIGYIRACLQERNTINGAADRTMGGFDSLIDRAESEERGGGTPMRDITPRSA